MVLWAIFAVELTGLVVLGTQRRWLIRAAQPALTRALKAGERRQGSDERLPLGEPEGRQRLQNVALTASGGLALPGAAAVVQSDLASEWCLPAFFLTGFARHRRRARGRDRRGAVARLAADARRRRRRGDDDDELTPVPGGPVTRAHLFNLRR